MHMAARTGGPLAPFVLFIALALSAPASAQEEPPPAKGGGGAKPNPLADIKWEVGPIDVKIGDIADL